MNTDNKAYLFKGNEDSAVYQCKKMTMKEKECGCSGLVDAELAEQPPSGPNNQPGGNYGGMPPGYGGGMPPGYGGGMPPGYGGGGMPPGCGGGMPPGYGGGMPPGYNNPMQNGYDPNCRGECGSGKDNKGYEEFGAELNGNALKIRVQKRKKAGSSCGEVQQEGDYSQGGPGGNQCNPCDPQFMNSQISPQQFGSNMGQANMGHMPKCPQYAGNNNNNQGKPLGCVNMDNNAISFAMPQQCPQGGGQGGANQNQPLVTYKMSECDAKCNSVGCGTCCKVIKIEPQSKSGPPGDGGSKAEDPSSDPTKDVFVLRIGKKSEGPDQKCKLELELKTPKRDGPKSNTTDHDTQFLASDIGPVGGGGKGKPPPKGKKGKGKK